MTPTQSVHTARCGEGAVAAELQQGRGPGETRAEIQTAITPGLLNELWHTCNAEKCGLSRGEFEQILGRIAAAQNFELTPGNAPAPAQQAAFFGSLRMADLVLARACAQGSEQAWERFIALHREPLLRAGMAITGSESLGRELADSLYAELYGLTAREGERRCPLDSYSGRGSLMGWLRTTLAQRHVDHHRRTHREEPLNESNDCPAPCEDEVGAADGHALPLLASVVREALEREGPDEKFLLASYYLDERKLHQIAAVLGIHEATVSRKLKRVTASVRKHIVRGLERRGLSRRAAEEALATDPRDLTAADELDEGGVRLKELLQTVRPGPFKEKA